MPTANSPLSRRRRDIWLLRAVALVITLLLWVTVLGGKKIEMTKRVTLDYQVPKNFVISNQVPLEVTFRVSGPRAFLKEFEERPITIPINLRTSQEGDYEVTIREDMLEIPIGLKVTAISQSIIPVKLDHLSTKRVPVRAVFKEDMPELRIRSVTLQPSTVDIVGPRGRLRNIEAVPTEPISASLETLKDAFVAKINLNDFPGVRFADLDQQQVEVSINTDGSPPRKWVKDVPVLVRLTRNGRNQKIDTDRLKTRIRPDSVNLYLEGSQSRLDSLKDGDIEVWAEVSDVNPGVHRSRLVWSLPPDLHLVKRSTDWVEVVIPVKE